jgi:hypothetical protein
LHPIKVHPVGVYPVTAFTFAELVRAVRLHRVATESSLLVYRLRLRAQDPDDYASSSANRPEYACGLDRFEPQPACAEIQDFEPKPLDLDWPQESREKRVPVYVYVPSAAQTYYLPGSLFEVLI